MLGITPSLRMTGAQLTDRLADLADGIAADKRAIAAVLDTAPAEVSSPMGFWKAKLRVDIDPAEYAGTLRHADRGIEASRVDAVAGVRQLAHDAGIDGGDFMAHWEAGANAYRAPLDTAYRELRRVAFHDGPPFHPPLPIDAFAAVRDSPIRHTASVVTDDEMASLDAVIRHIESNVSNPATRYHTWRSDVEGLMFDVDVAKHRRYERTEFTHMDEVLRKVVGSIDGADMDAAAGTEQVLAAVGSLYTLKARIGANAVRAADWAEQVGTKTRHERSTYERGQWDPYRKLEEEMYSWHDPLLPGLQKDDLLNVLAPRKGEESLEHLETPGRYRIAQAVSTSADQLAHELRTSARQMDGAAVRARRQEAAG